MYMVIFGAGASYDSLPSRPPSVLGNEAARPPLAKDLFLPERISNSALAGFPQCRPIIPYLQNTPPGGNLEHTLETLQVEAETDPERSRQLAAIRFYLHFLFWECDRDWNGVTRGITNYFTLLDQLRRQKEPVLLVTFNYDRQIENALPSVGVSTDDLSHYVKHPMFKLFKLQGSVHWAREVDTEISNIMERNVWDVGRELIDRVANLKISDRFRIVSEYPIGKVDGTALFPAIAIPVETKRGFECPEDHLECLRANLGAVAKILVVGWRATENHFLELWRNAITVEVPLQIVAGNRKDADEVLERLRTAGVKVAGEATDAGFSEYVVSRKAEAFFAK